ncbi:MAG: MmcQ/YjbR family DNA-binding protein [bacterium]
MKRITRPSARLALARIRKLCLSLPETCERPSHGAPTFFIRGKRAFVQFHDDHHGDGRLAIWCAATREVQRMLVEGAPQHYFIPPYVGHLGWLGVRLDRKLGWEEIAGVIEDAYLTVAPKKLVASTAQARRKSDVEE